MGSGPYVALLLPLCLGSIFVPYLSGSSVGYFRLLSLLGRFFAT